MRTALVRWVAGIVTTLMVVGCGPQPEAYVAQTPEELKQLTDVTDRVLLLLRNPDDGTAMRQAIEAVVAADRQYRQHGEAILKRENSDAIACIHSHAIEILDLETRIEKRDEAASRQDDAGAKRRTTMLRLLASDMYGCAVKSIDLLINFEQRREAIQHGAILISQIYSIVAITHAAAGRKPTVILQDQIRTYEQIVEKLGPKHQAAVITDALPKLKETLANLEKTQGL